MDDEDVSAYFFGNERDEFERERIERRTKQLLEVLKVSNLSIAKLKREKIFVNLIVDYGMGKITLKTVLTRLQNFNALSRNEFAIDPNIPPIISQVRD